MNVREKGCVTKPNIAHKRGFYLLFKISSSNSQKEVSNRYETDGSERNAAHSSPLKKRSYQERVTLFDFSIRT